VGSGFETVFSVPPKVGGVWPQVRCIRYSERSIWTNQLVQITRDAVRREDDAEVIAERHQAAIK